MWWSAKTRFKNFKHEVFVRNKATKTIRIECISFMSVVYFLSFLPLCSTTITCGGTYLSPQGVIQTPDFPNRFQTPIQCEWVIDARLSTLSTYSASAGSGNHSIVVYLTQVYVLEGLTFTQYYHYVKNEFESNEKYNLGQIDVNISTSYYVQSFANFLVIRLHLDSVIGTNLRVLHNLLNVYGLNITYEITSHLRENRCKMSYCGFTGYCYDNFKYIFTNISDSIQFSPFIFDCREFFCDCLPGFEGPYCSHGPKSLCVKNGKHLCRGNRICKLVGETAHKCETLAQGMPKSQPKRNFNEIVLRKSNKECDDCVFTCPFNKDYKNICDCSNLLSKEHNPQDVLYSGYLFVNNGTDWDTNTTAEISHKLISQTLQICNATTKKLTVNKTGNYEDGLYMHFRFFGFRNDKDQLMNCFHEVLDHNFDNILEKNITLDMEPTLYLKSLAINKLQPIHEGQEFILTCTAFGSPKMAFRWYKDKIFINITTPTNSNKWMQLLQSDLNVNNSNNGVYWSILVVSKAKELDEGRFTCQVIDSGRQQCASRRVQVTVVPTVFIQPTSLTVKQGEPFLIVCRGIWIKGIFESCQFNWYENGREQTNNFESLYPKGSLLRIQGINKSTNYSCTCNSEELFKKDTITAYVYNPEVEVPCKADNTKHLEPWPDTAPGGVGVVGCPNNYIGVVTRNCLLSTKTGDLNIKSQEKILGRWAEPDFTGCLHDELNYYKRNFEKLELGYDYTTLLKIINGYKSYVMNKDRVFLTSEGKRILILLDDILRHIKNSGNFSNIRKITNAILDITDALLSDAKSLCTINDIISMQQVVKKASFLYAKALNVSNNFTLKEFNIAINNNCNDNTLEKNSTQQVVCVSYNSLRYKILKALNGNVADFKLISEVKSVWILSDKVEETNLVVRVNISDWTVLEQSNFNDDFRAQCIVSEWGFKWNANGCSTVIDMHRHVARCQCGTDGAFAVAYVKKSKVSNRSIGANSVLVFLLYSISLLMSLFCVIMSILQYHSNNTAVSFMHSHTSLSKLIVCAIFLIGTYLGISEDNYLYILSTILFCYLLALSSQLSILLITYIELEDILHKERAKIFVFELFMVGPILVSIGNHVAHSYMSLIPPFWWVKMADNLSFNVFVICLVAMGVLFMALYWIVWNLIRKEIDLGCMFVYKKYNRVKKCSYVFCALLINGIISIFYINYLENLVHHYVLVFSFLFLDVTILTFISGQNFHLKNMVAAIREKTKTKMAKSLKSIYIFNKK